MILRNNGLLNKAQTTSDETKKSQATETMNLKITNIQISSYAETQELPNLQYLADKLCEDNDMEYVLTASKEHASLDKIDVTNISSIFTKLKEYPYEFEINSSLQLASIDGVKVADNEEQSSQDNWTKMNTWEKLFDIGFSIEEIANNEVILSKALGNNDDIQYMINHTTDIMPTLVNSKVAMKYIGNDKKVFKKIFGDSTENIPANTTWISAILNSNNAIEGIDETNPITVPIMTDNKSPYGEALASSEGPSYAAWKAFNGTISSNFDAWFPVEGTEETVSWIQYKFPNPILVYKFFIQNRYYQYPTYVNALHEFSLLASLDGTNWDNLGNYINNKSYSTESDTYIVQNISKRYLYYRIQIKNGMYTDGTVYPNPFVAIGRLQFYGK